MNFDVEKASRRFSHYYHPENGSSSSDALRPKLERSHFLMTAGVNLTAGDCLTVLVYDEIAVRFGNESTKMKMPSSKNMQIKQNRISWTFVSASILSIVGQVNAGIQITSSQIVKFGLNSSTNLVVTEIQTNALRVNIGALYSQIILPEAHGGARLFHQNKSFQWLNLSDAVSATNAVPPSPISSNVEFEGYSAKEYRCTNGTEIGRVWVTSNSVVFKWVTNGVSGVSRPRDLSARQTVGYPFDENSIVVGTEYIRMSSMPMFTVEAGSKPMLTNVVITETTRLVSVVETNFPSSEFEIPKDYVAGNGAPILPPVPMTQPDPTKSFGPAGRDTVDLFRKQYEQGKPPLAWPAGMSNPK